MIFIFLLVCITCLTVIVVSSGMFRLQSRGPNPFSVPQANANSLTQAHVKDESLMGAFKSAAEQINKEYPRKGNEWNV